jgi:NAD+ diphosphatase
MSDWRFCPLCSAGLETHDFGGLPRLICRARCGFVHWDNPAPVLAALVEYEGRILLARNHAWAAGAFGLITGFLERDEAPVAGVAREVREELGLETDAVTLIGVYPFARKHEVIIAYHVLAHGEIRLNEELAEFRLIVPEKLKAWDFGTGLVVSDWLARRRVGVIADGCNHCATLLVRESRSLRVRRRIVKRRPGIAAMLVVMQSSKGAFDQPDQLLSRPVNGLVHAGSM